MQYPNRGGFLSSISPSVRNLLVINVAVYVAQLLLGRWFTGLFMISAGNVIVHKMFWQVFTYQFLHSPGSFMHILFNMYALFIFGRELEYQWGSSRFLHYYLVTGTGAGVFILLLDLLAYLAGYGWGPPTLGASGAIFGILLAYGLFWPERQVFIWGIIGVRIKYLIIGYGVISALFLLPGSSGGSISHAGHLGGLISGILYFRWRRRDQTFTYGNNTLDRFFSKISGFFKSRPSAPSGNSSGNGLFNGINIKRTRNLDMESMTDREIEKTIDELLGIISRRGIKALTIEEQMFLDRASRLYRHKFPD
jgi:membrane associated rhomboid family serine protease